MAQTRHAQCADECPVFGAKATVTNGCLTISIYEYTQMPSYARLHELGSINAWD
jgi:hypothetical protein